MPNIACGDTVGSLVCSSAEECRLSEFQICYATLHVQTELRVWCLWSVRLQRCVDCQNFKYYVTYLKCEGTGASLDCSSAEVSRLSEFHM